MDINEIKIKYENLSSDLRRELSKMALTDRVFAIRDSIKDLQQMCPHTNGNYDFSHSDECPYCGKHFKG